MTEPVSDMNMKDLKMIKIPVPNIKSLLSMTDDIETIILKNEEIITKLLEKDIYVSTLSKTVKDELDKIFIDARKHILES
uniref:Uncharacterized protein n=1 Tax=viral metagenome TaxID=1070528 RepID=A0A6C0EYA0_9ZZZZ